MKLFVASNLQKTMGQSFQMESAGAVLGKHHLECFIIHPVTSPIYSRIRAGIDV